MNLPEELLHNPHFLRYYRTWERNPVSVVFIPLAQICREQGHLEEAREICEKGLEAHPDSVSGRVLMARVLFDMDRLDEARQIVVGILNDFPGQAEAAALHKQILNCRGQDPSAPQQGSISVSLWENLTMAKIYADQGEIRIALQIVEKILARDPQNFGAVQWRERLKP